MRVWREKKRESERGRERERMEWRGKEGRKCKRLR